MIQLDKYVTSKITTILVSIMTLYFLLVCPSIFISIYAENSDSSRHNNTPNYALLNALVITNTLQAVNFAVNFLLYFSMNPKFRKFFRRSIMCKSTSPKKGEYEQVHLRVR